MQLDSLQPPDDSHGHVNSIMIGLEWNTKITTPHILRQTTYRTVIRCSVTLLKIVMRLTTLLRELVTIVLRCKGTGNDSFEVDEVELTCCKGQYQVTRSFRMAFS
jgi:hypothetical protein